MRVVSHLADNGAVLFGSDVQIPSVFPPKSGPSVTCMRGVTPTEGRDCYGRGVICGLRRCEFRYQLQHLLGCHYQQAN